MQYILYFGINIILVYLWQVTDIIIIHDGGVNR